MENFLNENFISPEKHYFTRLSVVVIQQLLWPILMNFIGIYFLYEDRVLATYKFIRIWKTFEDKIKMFIYPQIIIGGVTFCRWLWYI